MDRQKEILDVFSDDIEQVLSKSEIIEKGGISYYHSTKKHVGFTLCRMVANGTLIRVKKGHYKRGGAYPRYKNEIITPNKNQTKLF
jgi:hypothetical protein